MPQVVLLPCVPATAIVRVAGCQPTEQCGSLDDRNALGREGGDLGMLGSHRAGHDQQARVLGVALVMTHSDRDVAGNQAVEDR
jgi:hypothetical protein